MMGSWYTGATRAQWLALTAALLGWMFDGFEQGIFPIVMRPALIDMLDLHVDDEISRDKSLTEQERASAKTRIDGQVAPWYGAITAAFLVGAALGGWGFGWLGDRIGRVRAMMLSVLAYSIFTGLCGLAQTPLQLMGLRFLAALGMGGEWALGVALVMESWSAHARPMLAGLIGAAANVGFMLAAFLVIGVEALGFLMREGGTWRFVLGACAIPALLTFFIRMFVPESEKWQAATLTGPKPSMIEIFTEGRWRRTIPGALLCAAALMGTWGAVQWVVPWASQIGGQAVAGQAQIALALGAILFAILAAVIGSKYSRRGGYFVLAVGALLSSQFLFRYFNGTTQVDISFLLSAFLVGGCTAAFYGWFPLYLPELFPTRLRATGQGFCFNIGRIIAAGGALMGSWLTSKEGPFKGDYAMMGATLSLVYLVAIGLAWFAPETKGQPLPD